MKPVAQEHPMGCAVACVASRCGMRYKAALALFDPKYAAKRGYYCKDIVNALKKKGLSYSFRKATSGLEELLEKEGTIVFVSPSAAYPAGHYLLKTQKGWMNPWINYPCITPAKAGFQRTLPGRAEWIIFVTI